MMSPSDSEFEEKALDPAVLRRGIEAVLDDANHGLYLVAETKGHAAGTLMVTWEWSDWRNGDFWWIQSAYVVPDFRRHGVFRMLFDKVHQEAKAASSVCGIRLYVEEDNERARQTYVDLGALRTDYALMEWDFSRSE